MEKPHEPPNPELVEAIVAKMGNPKVWKLLVPPEFRNKTLPFASPPLLNRPSHPKLEES